MPTRRFPSIPIILLAAFTCPALYPSLSSAQENPEADSSESKVDAPGCTDLTVLPKLAASIILSCHNWDSVTVSMPLTPDAAGYAREKTVRGSYEFREYQILQEDQQGQAFDNLLQLLPMAGFKIKYSASPSTITARKEDVWILTNLSGDSYNVSVIHAQEESWKPVKDAEEISREIETNHRVAIYGIQFSSDNEAIVEENSKILGEVLKYLKANPKVKVVVESHKMNENGNSQEDMEITQKRSKTLVTWLEAHGIAAGRLDPKALGRSKPLTENDTELEIQRNERIEMVNAASVPASP
jgi:OOP family OmpA-OmpF porin